MNKYIKRGIAVFFLVFGTAVSVALATLGDFRVTFWICAACAVIWIVTIVSAGLE